MLLHMYSWEYGTLASCSIAGQAMGLPYSNCFSDERAGSRSVARTVMEQTFQPYPLLQQAPPSKYYGWVGYL